MRIRPLMLVALLACTKAPAATTPKEPTSTPPVEEKPDPALLRDIAAGIEDVLETMARIAEGSPDCPAMAVSLNQLFDQSAELFDLARTQAADPDAAPLLTAEFEKRSAGVQPAVDRISRGLARCKLDPEVAAAIERMPTF
ncbi:MAG TPA: hypothetical protein VM261_11830 [Kofleriaceae bacterium]|nr:hypothetical protein [Kofleriaceae bacterium]